METLARSLFSFATSSFFWLRFFIDSSLRRLGRRGHGCFGLGQIDADPGPMVEVSVIFLTYLPLAAAGLALTTAASRACAFSASLAASKLILPIGE